jgi:hypothetical protein
MEDMIIAITERIDSMPTIVAAYSNSALHRVFRHQRAEVKETHFRAARHLA